jgi:hypothetical protein
MAGTDTVNGGGGADIYNDSSSEHLDDWDGFNGGDGRDWANIQDRDTNDSFFGQGSDDACPFADCSFTGGLGDIVDLGPDEDYRFGRECDQAIWNDGARNDRVPRAVSVRRNRRTPAGGH